MKMLTNPGTILLYLLVGCWVLAQLKGLKWTALIMGLLALGYSACFSVAFYHNQQIQRMLTDTAFRETYEMIEQGQATQLVDAYNAFNETNPEEEIDHATAKKFVATARERSEHEAEGDGERRSAP